MRSISILNPFFATTEIQQRITQQKHLTPKVDIQQMLSIQSISSVNGVEKLFFIYQISR